MMMARSIGAAAGISLAILIAYLEICAIRAQEAGERDPMYALMAIFIGLPLFALNVGMTVHLCRRKAAYGAILFAMWLSPLAAMLITPAWKTVTGYQDDVRARAHPPISELHVNLSGRDLWLAPEVAPFTLAADAEAVRLVLRRQTRKNQSDPMAEYAGLLPAPGFKQLRIFPAPPAHSSASMMPVVIAPLPDLSQLEPAFAGRGGPQLAYMYYHYPDRVEVAPGLRLYRLESNSAGTAHVPFVVFYPRNMGGPTLARIEIDGQTLALEHTMWAEAADKPCWASGAPAINRLAAQFNPAWREATVAVPPFAGPEPAQGSATRNAVHLYFMPDGSVTAQREQMLVAAGGEPGVRVTEPPQLASRSSCGTAADMYKSMAPYR